MNDVPGRSDRELLIDIYTDITRLNTIIAGENGLTETVKSHSDKINDLQKWQGFITGIGAILVLLVGLGRYIDIWGK